MKTQNQNQETKYIDLHSHTFYSDGIDPPSILIKAQKMKGLDIVAITDHDNFGGYWEAKETADEWGIVLIPGVEFSAGKYHILGLNFNPENPKILETIAQSKQLQRENTRKRTEILAAYGVPISIEKIEHYFSKARFGKMNILMTLFRDPECREYLEKTHKNQATEEIREFYLGKKGIAGSEEVMTDLEKETIINSIHEAGGIAILAHPAKDVKDIEKELGEFRKAGIDGLEIQPRFYQQSLPFIDYAKKHNLLLTYGSDFHGSYMDRQLLARTFNKLSPELEERLNLDKKNYEDFELIERGLVYV